MPATRSGRDKRRRSRVHPYDVDPSKIQELDENLNNKWNKAETTLAFSEYRDLYRILAGQPELLLVDNRELRLWQAHYMSCFGEGNSTTTPTDRALAIGFVTEAAEFYVQLVEDIRVNHGLSEEYSEGCWEVESQNEEQQNKLMKARQACCRLLIRCGDLTRYKEIFINGRTKADFSATSLFYGYASEAAYWNGYPHNQMAVITVDKDPLESLYHCFRSIFADIPAAEIGLLNYKLIMDSVAIRANAVEQEDWTFSVFFCHVVVRALLSKSEMVPDLLLDNMLHKLPKADSGVHTAIALIVCVEDAFTGTISKDVWPVPDSYLLYLLKVVFKFLVRLTQLGDQAWPALGILLVWLVGRVNLVASSKRLKKAFCNFVQKDAPVSLFARELRGHGLSSLPDEVLLDGIKELWEDKLLRGFTLLRRNLTEIGTAHSLNLVRLRRIQATLRIMSRSFPDKHLKLDEDGEELDVEGQELEVPPDHMLICTQEDELRRCAA